MDHSVNHYGVSARRPTPPPPPGAPGGLWPLGLDLWARVGSPRGKGCVPWVPEVKAKLKRANLAKFFVTLSAQATPARVKPVPTKLFELIIYVSAYRPYLEA